MRDVCFNLVGMNYFIVVCSRGFRNMSTSTDFQPFGDPLCIVVSRENVESANIEPVLEALKSLIKSPQIARANMEKVDIAFDGYNYDNRELDEIEEVRNYVFDLDDKFPYWLFFLSKNLSGLHIILRCSLLPYLTDEAIAEMHPKQIQDLLTKRWLPALYQVSEFAGLSESEDHDLMDRSLTYIWQDPNHGVDNT